jgi:hypothetical protein
MKIIVFILASILVLIFLIFTTIKILFIGFFFLIKLGVILGLLALITILISGINNKE